MTDAKNAMWWKITNAGGDVRYQWSMDGCMWTECSELDARAAGLPVCQYDGINNYIVFCGPPRAHLSFTSFDKETR